MDSMSGMSGMDMPSMSSMPDMPMETSHMHSTGMMHMDMEHMSMTFFTSTTTPFLSEQWTPSSTGTYAGTCVFLVVLSILLRLLYAFKVFLELKWHKRALNRRYIVTADTDSDLDGPASKDDKAKEGVLTVNGVNEKVRIVQSSDTMIGKFSQPWRLSVDLPRACLFTVMAGVGYLLMLAVMTMNVGYFLSVLAGAFAGELVVGRYINQVEHHH